MTVGCEDELKLYFKIGKYICAEFSIRYGHLAVFIRHDSGEIRGFRYELTLGIGVLIITASTSVSRV